MCSCAVKLLTHCRPTNVVIKPDTVVQQKSDINDMNHEAHLAGNTSFQMAVFIALKESLKLCHILCFLIPLWH